MPLFTSIFYKVHGSDREAEMEIESERLLLKRHKYVWVCQVYKSNNGVVPFLIDPGPVFEDVTNYKHAT